MGNIADVYPIRHVGKNDTPVVNFNVAVTPRVRNSEGEWENGETEWVSVTAWERLAENVAKTFNKGDRVIIVGNARVSPGGTTAEGKEYEPRTTVTAQFVGVDLTFDPASSEREAKNRTTAQEEGETGEEKPKRKRSTGSKPKRSQREDDFDFDDNDELDDDEFSF